MVKNNVVSHLSIERWMSKRKVYLLLEIIKRHMKEVDNARSFRPYDTIKISY